MSTLFAAFSKAQDSDGLFSVVIILIIILILILLIQWWTSGNLDDSKGARAYDVETLVRRIQYNQKKKSANKKKKELNEDTYEARAHD